MAAPAETEAGVSLASLAPNWPADKRQTRRAMMQCLSVSDGCKTKGLERKIAAAISLKWSRCDAQPLLAWERKTERDRWDREKCFKTAGRKIDAQKGSGGISWLCWDLESWLCMQQIISHQLSRLNIFLKSMAVVSRLFLFFQAHLSTPVESLHKLCPNPQKDLGQGKLPLFKGLQRFNDD